MHTVTSADLARLLDQQQAPCVSIYFPTEKTYPDRHQGATRYGNLVDRVEEALRRKYPAGKIQPLLA